ncbi:MAG: hypothetical protein Q7R84_01380 [bacterium]|nr:hypothetical protein [bacterium]
MTFGKEPQILRPDAALKKEALSPKPFYEILEETEKKLKEAGAEKRDIEAALLLMKQIGFLDRRVFPKNPAAFNFALKGEDLAGFIIPEGDGKERSYQIMVSGLAKLMENKKKQDVSIFDSEGRRKSDKQFTPGLSIAAHEIRHRAQRDLQVKQFAPGDAEVVKDDILRSIIKFQEMLFKETEKIYRREKRSEEFIKEKLSPKEFDASVIERFIGNKLNDIPKRLGSGMEIGDLDEFASIIQMSAPEK